MSKQDNKITAEKLCRCMFWRQPNFTQLFADNIEVFFPYAPPGMPTYFDRWETECCFEWLNRTVKSWQTDDLHVYSTPDEQLFWATGKCHGDVHWGNIDSVFSSEFIAKIWIDNCKVYKVKLQMNPLDFLYAAGRNVPIFRMDIHDPSVDEYLEKKRNTSKTVKVDAEDLRTPEQKKEDNLKAMYCGIEREKYRKLATVSKDFFGDACWVPPEMDNPEFSIDLERREAWTKASSPWFYRYPLGIINETDDPHLFFAEMSGKGPVNWRGNHNDGHYHQSYFIIIKINDDGDVCYSLEALNSINKFNAENISIPSFPYYM